MDEVKAAAVAEGLLPKRAGRGYQLQAKHASHSTIALSAKAVVAKASVRR